MVEARDAEIAVLREELAAGRERDFGAPGDGLGLERLPPALEEYVDRAELRRVADQAEPVWNTNGKQY